MSPSPSPSLTFAERFWALAPGPEHVDVPEPLRTIVIVRHFLAVLDVLARGQRKTVPALGAMLRAAEIDGCASYASPEQLSGEPLDTRSVVFSLGVVLFERLAGRHPFGAENNRSRRITRIQRGEMGSGVNSFPTIAASVRSVLVRAMNPFPEERWPDLRPMRDILSQFLTSDAPAPRLPGTSSDVDGQPPVESTKVVRRATDFGRELMAVVARHDRGDDPPKPLRPASWPGDAEAPAPRVATRTSPPPTPRLGVTQLRPPAPRRLVPALDDPSLSVSDSEITRIDPDRIDPLAATMRVSMPVGGDEPANDIDDDVIAAPILDPDDQDPGAPVWQRLEMPLRAPSDPVPDLRVASRSKTLVVALASAAIGAGIATIAVMALRPDAPRRAVTEPAASPSPSPSPTVAEVEPLVAPTPASETATGTATGTATATGTEPATEPAAGTEPAAEPATAAGTEPATEAAAAAAPSTADPAARVEAAIAGCFDGASHRVIGVSVVARGEGAKAYFGPGDLSPHERGCIAAAVKPLRDMPAKGLYKIRVDDDGVAVSLKH